MHITAINPAFSYKLASASVQGIPPRAIRMGQVDGFDDKIQALLQTTHPEVEVHIQGNKLNIGVPGRIKEGDLKTQLLLPAFTRKMKAQNLGYFQAKAENADELEYHPPRGTVLPVVFIEKTIHRTMVTPQVN